MNDYLAEARSNAPSAVKDAVVALGAILYRKESQGVPFDDADREAVLYLRDVAGKDPIPINRAASISALAMLQSVDSSQVFLEELKDPFWLSRFESARALAYRGDEKFAEPLRDLLKTEARPEVRLEIVKALGRIKGSVALRTLLEVFLGPNEGSRDSQVQAFLAVREMTGLRHGFEEKKTWEEFYRSKFNGSIDSRDLRESTGQDLPAPEKAGGREEKPPEKAEDPGAGSGKDRKS